jgi:hypothetical protein
LPPLVIGVFVVILIIAEIPFFSLAWLAIGIGSRHLGIYWFFLFIAFYFVLLIISHKLSSDLFVAFFYEKHHKY